MRTHARARKLCRMTGSYVSEDKRTAFCVYNGPTPEAIRKTAARDELPVERITEVRVLSPYFYS
jgi:hypothetical protein